MRLKLKGGAYVDPESGLEDKAHVYKSGSGAQFNWIQKPLLRYLWSRDEF